MRFWTKKTSYTKPELAKMLDEIQLCHDVSASVHGQMKEVAEELDLLGNRKAVKRDAVVAHKAAARSSCSSGIVSTSRSSRASTAERFSTFRTGRGDSTAPGSKAVSLPRRILG